MPLRAVSTSGSPSRRFPHRRRLPSLGFLNPSTACTPKHLVGLFHPTRTSRLLPSGFSPRLEQNRLVADSLPSCGYRQRTSLLPVRPVIDPTSGPYSPRESVAPPPQLSDDNARYPRGLSPLQGLLPRGRGSHFGEPPLSSLFRNTYETYADCSPGSCLAREWFHLSRGVQPS